MQLYPYSEYKSHFSLDFCHGLSMFGALSDDSLSFLLEQGQLFYMEPGDRLFSQGDDSTMFYVMFSGESRFYQPDADGDTVVGLRKYVCGEQIGFVGMIGLHQRRGTTVMEKPGYVFEITAALFHDFCDKFPEDFKIFLINITREMSREISHLDKICADTQGKSS